MEKFIVGALVENEPGAQYQSGIYDRNLVLKHSSGLLLRIFDGFDCLSTELVIGSTCEFVLYPLILKNVSISTEEAIKVERMWTGKILSTTFKFEQDCCRLQTSNFLSREWILIATSLGQAVLSSRELRSFIPEIQIGDWIRFEFLRLDLSSVI